MSVGGTRFGVRTTSPAFGAWLERTLAAYRQVRPARFKYSAVVREAEPESGKRPVHVLYRWTGIMLRTTSVLTLARVLLEELGGGELAGRRDAVYLPAGVFAVGGRAAVVPTITVPVLNRAPVRAWNPGVTVSSGVAVAIDPDSGRLVPVRSSLRIPQEALAGLRAFGGSDAARMFVHEPLAVEAVIRFGASGDQVVQPDSRVSALYELVPTVLNLDTIGKGTALIALGRLIEGARAYLIGPHRPMPTLTALTDVLAASE
jgi:hypothetical protein